MSGIMKKIQDPFPKDCHASREFLLNSPIVPEYRIQCHPPEESQIRILKNVFPNLTVGETFISQWIAQQDRDSAFGAMAFNIDADVDQAPAMDGCKAATEPKEPVKDASRSTDSHTEINSEDDHLTALARILDDVVPTDQGCWGLIYHGIMGLFISGLAPEAYDRFANNIRTAFRHVSQAELSIGMALFPFEPFENHQTMDNAVKALDHAAFLGPNTTVAFDAVSLNISGDRLYGEGDIEGSIAEFEHALKLDIANVNVRNSLGVCYGVLKEYDKALSQFEAAIGIAPGEVMAVYNYGLVKLLTGHPNQALTYLLQAEGIRGDIFEVLYHIGKVYVQLNESNKGLEYLTKAKSLNSHTAGVYRLIGRCHADLGAPDQAIAAYTQAVRINPDDAHALSDLGRQYDLRDENQDIALLFCERSTLIEPKNGHFHHRLGRLYYKAQKPTQALAAFEKAHTLGYDSQDSIDEINAMLEMKTEKAGSM